MHTGILRKEYDFTALDKTRGLVSDAPTLFSVNSQLSFRIPSALKIFTNRTSESLPLLA